MASDEPEKPGKPWPMRWIIGAIIVFVGLFNLWVLLGGD